MTPLLSSPGTRLLLAGLAALAAGAARADDDPVRPYLPDGTRIVCVVNVQTLLASPLVHKYAPAVKDAAFSAVKSHAVQEVHQATAAYAGAAAADRATVILRGKIDPEMFDKEMKDAAAAGRVKAYEAPGGHYYEETKPDRLLALGAVHAKMFFAALDDQTMVISFGDDASVKEALAVKSGAKKPAENKALAGLLDRLDAKDAVGLAMVGAFRGRLPAGLVPEPLMAAIAPFAQGFQGDQAPGYDRLVAAARIEDDIQARATAFTADADAAHRLAQAARDGLKQLRDAFGLLVLTAPEAKLFVELLNGAKVEETDAEVTLTGTMPAAPAGLLIKLAAAKGK